MTLQLNKFCRFGDKNLWKIARRDSKVFLPAASVSRFGENSSLWQHFKSFRHFFEGLFSLGQNFETSWEKIFVIEIIFMVVNGWKLTNNVAIRTHCSSSSMHACVRVHSMKSLQQKKWFKSFSRNQLLLLQKLYELFIQIVLP